MQKPIVIVGDIHGNPDAVMSALLDADLVIQLGDFCLGKEETSLWKRMEKFHTTLKVVAGNHENYPVAKTSKLYAGDFGEIVPDVFFVRGAESIDKAQRVEGVDWFKEETFTFAQQEECLQAYLKAKPKVVISHQAPKLIQKWVFGIHSSCPTAALLQEMFN